VCDCVHGIVDAFGGGVALQYVGEAVELSGSSELYVSIRRATSVEEASRCRKFCHCSYWRLPIIANNGSWRHRSPVSAGTGM
jgi:hypothetical protein